MGGTDMYGTWTMQDGTTVLRRLTKIIVDTVVVLEDAGYGMSDTEFELNEICSDYADEAGNGFAEFRRMLE